jgi:hypothetical protein
MGNFYYYDIFTDVRGIFIMKLNVFAYIFLLFAYIFFVTCARAENIHFNKDIYILKTINQSVVENRFENEYYPQNDTADNWGKLIGIYYYPDIKNVLNFARDKEKNIEEQNNVVLLKFIENKKQNKAVLSYLVTGEWKDRIYFEHNIYKYEPHPKKGTMVLRYAKRYFFDNKEEVTNIGHEIKNINDDLMEQIIISPIPPIVEE